MSTPAEDPREHERKAREHDRHERSPAGEDEADEAAGKDVEGDDVDRPAPPGTPNTQ